MGWDGSAHENETCRREERRMEERREGKDEVGVGGWGLGDGVKPESQGVTLTSCPRVCLAVLYCCGVEPTLTWQWSQTRASSDTLQCCQAMYGRSGGCSRRNGSRLRNNVRKTNDIIFVKMCMYMCKGNGRADLLLRPPWLWWSCDASLFCRRRWRIWCHNDCGFVVLTGAVLRYGQA